MHTDGYVKPRLVFGGPGVVVQIDESLYHHKPKVTEQNLNCILQRMSNFSRKVGVTTANSLNEGLYGVNA